MTVSITNETYELLLKSAEEQCITPNQRASQLLTWELKKEAAEKTTPKENLPINNTPINKEEPLTEPIHSQQQKQEEVIIKKPNKFTI